MANRSRTLNILLKLESLFSWKKKIESNVSNSSFSYRIGSPNDSVLFDGVGNLYGYIDTSEQKEGLDMINKELNINHFEKKAKDRKTIFYYEGLNNTQWQYIIKSSSIFNLSIFNFNPDGIIEFSTPGRKVVIKKPSTK